MGTGVTTMPSPPDYWDILSKLNNRLLIGLNILLLVILVWFVSFRIVVVFVLLVWLNPRPISISQLNMSPCLHLWPINLVVFKGSYFTRNGRTHLGVSFTLRCFQRLSSPYVATQLCHWRDNWCTIGMSIPVLSY